MTRATTILQAQSPRDYPAAIQESLSVLTAGGLVVFPTETVYGIAVNATRPDALERLNTVKQRPDNKPYTLHVGSFSQIQRYVPDLPALHRTFLKKALPGPLTAVFDLNADQWKKVCNILPQNELNALYSDRSLGVRLPDQPFAKKLLSQADFPIVAPSANISGQPAPFRAEQAIENIDGLVDLVIDAGPTRYAKSSTVVRLSDRGLEVLREGVLDKGTLDRMYALQILFVCTGNSCSSPMAEGLCKVRLARHLNCPIDSLADRRYKVVSAGTSAFGGAPATPEAIDACEEYGADISAHQARLLTVDVINQSDRIYTMTRSHRQAVIDLVPQAADKTELLSRTDEIDDPIGRSAEHYRQCARQIDQAFQQRLKELLTTDVEKG